jgi:hypothetical protein
LDVEANLEHGDNQLQARRKEEIGEREEKEKEEENCADNQKSALKCGYCCDQHVKVAKMELEESKKQKKKKEGNSKQDDTWTGPLHQLQ